MLKEELLEQYLEKVPDAIFINFLRNFQKVVSCWCIVSSNRIDIKTFYKGVTIISNKRVLSRILNFLKNKLPKGVIPRSGIERKLVRICPWIREIERVYIIKKPYWLPYVIGFEITRKCNLSCNHCYLKSKSLYKHRNSEMRFEILKEIVLKYETFKYSITGGEPFVYSRIKDFLRILEKTNSFIYISTNGTLLDKFIDLLKKFKDRLILGISLDSIREETAIKIRGSSYKLSKVLRNIRRFSKEGFEMVINFTPTVYNTKKEEILNILDFVKSLERVPKIKINSPLPSKITPTDSLSFLKRYWSFLRDISNIDGVYYEIFPPDIATRYLKCNGGIDGIFLDVDLRVHPCTLLRNVTFGILREAKDLEKVLKSKDRFRWVRKHRYNIRRNTKCKNCKYFKNCHLGCPARSYLTFGDLYIGDPLCQNLWKILQ